MKKIRMEIELEYDDKAIHGDDSFAKEWFLKEILLGADSKQLLIMHSNEIGDEVGTIKVIRIFST